MPVANVIKEKGKDVRRKSIPSNSECMECRVFLAFMSCFRLTPDDLSVAVGASADE